MATLSGAVNSSAGVWTISADLDDAIDYLQVESEIVRVVGNFPAQYQSPTNTTSASKIRVERAAGGTTAASHANGTTLTPVIPPAGVSGAAEAGTVDLGDDVLIYQGSGPPASTDGAGRQKLVVIDQPDGSGVFDAGGDVNVPLWSQLPGALVNGGEAADPSAGAGVPGSEGDFYVQDVADPAFGRYAMLWTKGPGGDTDWATVDVYPIGTTFPPVDAADAFGVDVAGPGSKYIDRSNPSGDVWWSQIGAKAAPVWAPQVASMEAFAIIPASVEPGLIRLVNLTLPAGDGITSPEGTYENIKALLASAGSAAEWLGLPYPLGVRIGALFHHVLSAPTQAAGIRLRWDEVNYLFYADQPVADPDTGVITYTELAANDTALAGALVQMLLIAYIE